MTQVELNGVLKAVGKLLPPDRRRKPGRESTTTHFKSLRQRKPSSTPKS